MAKKVTLFYGGQQIDLPADQADLLRDYRGEEGTIKANLGGGRWLTIATGPSIPIAIVVEPASTPQVF